MSSEVVFQKNLIKVSAKDNNNKFWNIKAYSDGTVYREWGRVNKSMKSPQKLTEHYSNPEKKAAQLANQKLKNQYQEVSLIEKETKTASNALKETALEQMNKGKSQEVQSLIEQLVSTNIHNILSETDLSYDKNSGLFSTPMGIVGRESVEKAKKLLKQITTQTKKSNFDSNWEQLCEQYLMIIPHELGSKVDLHSLFGDTQKIQKEENILKNLESSIEMVETEPASSADVKNNVFDVDIDIVTDSDVIDYVREKFQRNLSSKHPSSRLKVNRVFDVNIKSMTEQYQQVEQTIGNPRKLWHGTRIGNLLSILHKGMYIPPTRSNIVTGRMFGNGLYFSDISTKALNYSYGTWNRNGLSKSNGCYYALICNVLLGKEFHADQTHFQNSNYYPQKGYDSTVAKAGTLGLVNNEMIVYDSKQVSPRYLVEFKE